MNVSAKPGSASIEIHGNFVDGREIEAGNGAMLDVHNPATGEVPRESSRRISAKPKNACCRRSSATP